MITALCACWQASDFISKRVMVLTGLHQTLIEIPSSGSPKGWAFTSGIAGRFPRENGPKGKLVGTWESSRGPLTKDTALKMVPEFWSRTIATALKGIAI